ncbi:MAG: restriction endonuclease subunit S [Rhodobacteraceae bacterium]|nr:restriction endonuclease subunit S [Paracoccaceae bacterium]MYF45204.1 restriction endonuclease subunit S [Paracoccaceae bacterium]MYI91784.1 restriction endonuclease subunit S [Paracoccaceae bacterium]
MELRLKEIAKISSGATFRSRIEAHHNGGVRVIQMKDLGDDNFVHIKGCIQIEHSALKPDQIVKIGDLIFRSRGQNNSVALLNEEVTDTILAAPLLRLRPNKFKVLPEYLLWWINQPSSQNYLMSRSEGSTVKMVSKSGLEDMMVSLPSMKEQIKIAKFFYFSQQEQKLLEELKNCKEILTHRILMLMASKSRQKASNKKSGFDETTS